MHITVNHLGFFDIPRDESSYEFAAVIFVKALLLALYEAPSDKAVATYSTVQAEKQIYIST
jgi:hypothetical protein